MAEETKKDKQTKSGKNGDQPISETQRFRYIGFDVYPGKPKDLFKSDAERTKWVEAVKAKREKGEIIREGCTLMEDRVSIADKVVMVIASIAILASLFLPWFGAYNETVSEVQMTPSQMQVEESTTPGGEGTTTIEGGAVAEGGQAQATAPEGATAEQPAEQATPPAGEPPAAAGQGGGQAGQRAVAGEGDNEQVILGHQQKKKVVRELDRISGLGTFGALGTVLPKMFSSGFAAAVVTILMLVFLLSSIAVPILAVVGIFSGKGGNDERALRLKKMLRLAWIPPSLFILSLILSFLGGAWGFDAQSWYTSLGESFSVAVFLGSISYGVVVALGGFILLAAKGAEI